MGFQNTLQHLECGRALERQLVLQRSGPQSISRPLLPEYALLASSVVAPRISLLYLHNLSAILPHPSPATSNPNSLTTVKNCLDRRFTVHDTTRHGPGFLCPKRRRVLATPHLWMLPPASSLSCQHTHRRIGHSTRLDMPRLSASTSCPVCRLTRIQRSCEARTPRCRATSRLVPAVLPRQTCPYRVRSRHLP